jgi:hypothetical protein
MTQTTHLALPFIEAAQAQKHVTHNEALALIDALTQLAVSARNVTSPPATPAEGDRVLIGAGATGAFAGKSDQIATFLAGGWAFLSPQAGWRAYVEAESLLLLYDGAGWIDCGLSLRQLQNLALLGIGATADGANPLLAKLNATLFTAKYVADGGDGDLRFALNKESAANTVSQLYESNYSARAETGLTGDDNFHVKVSPDGSTWKEAVVVDKSTGNVGIGSSVVPDSPFTINANSGATDAPSTDTVAHLIGADGHKAGFLFDAFAQNSFFNSRRANGSRTSKSPLLANDIIMSFQNLGWNGASYGVAASIVQKASENFSASANGGEIEFRTTAVGTTNVTKRGGVSNGGTLYAGSGAGDLAAGATEGFLGIPTVNGVPTGTPNVTAGGAALSGVAYLAFDRANNKLMIYVGGAWRGVTLT